jgi:hypothetical protein
MRSEQEMLRLVQDKVVRLRRRRRLAVLGAAAAISLMTGIGVTSVLADGEDQIRTGPARGPDPAGQPSDGQAVVPDLVGLTIDEAVTELHDAGFSGNPALFQSRYIASDNVEIDIVMAQEPPPATISDANDAIAIDVSAGGPTISFDELPMQAQSFTSQLPGYDETEPILAASTGHGTAYKTDTWLFGPCAAVDDAYRTFADPAYGDRCY